MSFRLSPGDCPICGQAHTACSPTGTSGAITTVMVPARDAVSTHDETLAAAVANNPSSVSTKTYRRKAR